MGRANPVKKWSGLACSCLEGMPRFKTVALYKNKAPVDASLSLLHIKLQGAAFIQASTVGTGTGSYLIKQSKNERLALIRQLTADYKTRACGTIWAAKLRIWTRTPQDVSISA